MKILIFDNSGLIINKGDYCVETNTGKFAKELKDLGNIVTFFGQKIETTNDTVHDFAVLKSGMFVLGRKRLKYRIINYLALYYKSIAAIYRSDFVYIFYPNAFKFTAFIAKFFGVKFGIYIRGMEDLDDWYSHWIYKNATTVFTVSSRFTSFVDGVVGQEIAHTIRPMIPFNENDIIRSRVYVQKAKYELMFLGRTSNDKGLIEILNAIFKLKLLRNDFHLTIVGTGEYIKELKKLSTDLEVNDVVDFIGGVYDVKEIEALYSRADIFLLPSYHEGFPRTLYEAMIFGTPILTTFVGGISEHMINGKNCLELEVKSVESITTSLNYAMSNYEKMGILALNATKTVKQIFETRKFTHATSLNSVIMRPAPNNVSNNG